jgi:hypothetical protein
METPTDRIDKRGRLTDSFRDAPILISGFLLPYDPRNSAILQHAKDAQFYKCEEVACPNRSKYVPSRDRADVRGDLVGRERSLPKRRADFVEYRFNQDSRK